MLSPLVRRRKGFRTPYPVKNAGVGRNTDPAARTSPPGCTAWKARRFGSPRTPWQAHRRACTIRRCRGGGCSARRSEPPAPRTVPQSGTESIPQGSWTRRNPPVKRLRPYVRRSLLVAPSTSPRLWTTLPLPRMRIPSSRSGDRLLPISIRCSGASDTLRLIWITGINAKRDTSGAGRTRHRGPGRVPPCFAPLFAWTSPRRVCPSIRSGTGNRDLWSSELRRERDRLSGATQLRTHRCNAEQPGVRRSAAGHGQGVDTWAHNDFVGDH